MSARDFYKGTFETALAGGEVLSAIRIPIPPRAQGQAYAKLKRKVGDYATAAAAVALTLDGDTCSAAAIGLTNVAPAPLFAEAAAQTLVGTAVDATAIEQAVERAVEITDPVADTRGPVAYRKHAAGVMTRRAIETALSRAKGA